MIKIELFKNASGFWKWRVKANNGKIIAECVDSYKRKVGAQKGIASLTKHIHDSFYTIVDGQDEPQLSVIERNWTTPHPMYHYRGPR